jgi:hypothetical protein
MTDDRVQTLHPDPAKSGPRIDRTLYDAAKTVILEAAAADNGVAFGELSDLLKRRAPTSLFEGRSPGWYATTVKLDLEARGLIERLPGRGPQRLKRVG